MSGYISSRREFIKGVGLGAATLAVPSVHAAEQDSLLAVNPVPRDLDVTASRTADRVYLHVVNTLRDRSITAQLAVEGMRIASGRIFEMAADPEYEVIETQLDGIVPIEKSLPLNGRWTFPPASVSAVELDVQKA